MTPALTTHPLHRADGSATITTPLFTILASVNGPVEVQRRDELPEEAAIEVNVRPASGVGGPRERWLETSLASLLKVVVLVTAHPRTLVQVTLQVLKTPEKTRLGKRWESVALIPALINASFAALVDSGVPLERTVVAALGAVIDDEVVVEPDGNERGDWKSVHALAFNANGELLFNESAGQFGEEEWKVVCQRLRQYALDAVARTGEDESMANGMAGSDPWLRKTLEENARRAGAWREAG